MANKISLVHSYLLLCVAAIIVVLGATSCGSSEFRSEKKQAKQGDVEAQYKLGNMYYHEVAMALAEKEYDVFRKNQDLAYISDFDKIIKQFK